MMTLDRAELLRVCGLVRPALAAADFVPAWQHIQFKDGYATAFNDVMAISVMCKNDIDCCLPGDVLVRALASLTMKDVAATPSEGTLVLSSGRSKIKLPTLPLKAFEFVMPFGNGKPITLTQELVTAIAACSLSMGNDPKHPASMGVTIEQDDGFAVVYSTDRITACRVQTATKIELPAGVPLILPAHFCAQIERLQGTVLPTEWDTEVQLHILDGALLLEFGERAILYTKTLVDVEPMEFGRVFAQHLDPKTIEQKTSAVPDAMDGAIERALLMLGKTENKATRFRAGGQTLLMVTESGNGVADDELDFKASDVDCLLDPALLARGLKLCSRIAFLKKSAVLTAQEGRFIYLVSYVPGRK